MNKRIKRQLRLLTIAAATGAFIGLSGCASTSDFDSLQSQLNAQINAAAADAAAAKAEAAAASAKADQAFNTAMEANKRSMDTEAKIDNMFKKAMHK